MAIYQRLRGSPAILFERLIDADSDHQDVARNGSEVRTHDEQNLRASIARELTDLLNTRLPISITALEQRARSTVDYGLPDLSAFPVGQHDALVRLARHVRQAIMAYEPRLRAPLVEICGSPTGADSLVAAIQGSVQIGNLQMPVAFELALGGGVPGGGVLGGGVRDADAA